MSMNLLYNLVFEFFKHSLKLFLCRGFICWLLEFLKLDGLKWLFIIFGSKGYPNGADPSES